MEIKIHKHWRIDVDKLRTLRRMLLNNLRTANKLPKDEERMIEYLIDYYVDHEHLTKFTPCKWRYPLETKKQPIIIACNKDGVKKEITACYRCEYNELQREIPKP
jgi:hypothetical protein